MGKYAAFICIGIAWIVTCIAVIYAMNITNSVGPLWAFLIPAMLSTSSSKE